MKKSYFQPMEYCCPCSKECEATRAGLHPELLDKLNLIRAALGAKIQITSGLRCQRYQDQLKARGYQTAVNSPHVPGNYGKHGIAVDIRCEPKPFAALLSLVSQHFMAIGQGKGWIHVDLRTDKKRYWTYNY